MVIVIKDDNLVHTCVVFFLPFPHKISTFSLTLTTGQFVTCHTCPQNKETSHTNRQKEKKTVVHYVRRTNKCILNVTTVKKGQRSLTGCEVLWEIYGTSGQLSVSFLGRTPCSIGPLCSIRVKLVTP